MGAFLIAKVRNPTHGLRISKTARKRGGGAAQGWLALAAIRCFEAKGFSGLALAVLVRALAVNGLFASGPAVQREAPHVDSCRRGSNSRPHRLLDPSACHSVLLRDASLSKPSKFNPARDRRVGLLAIGQCLKEQYDALTTPMPRHLAALVQQLEMQR